ncbi:MAG: undecaprenyl/decaprenyl-phosphate alpha-N-acetylglucosaminyl 1-phosphate transferase [Phycisphaeraceae bacterium]|nr:undecaprenyl/decaprenyl-phosphate alpha-N-acetylglucosaminyl 1-phosphate transferase [Phycisphaeraceae bacterium]
MTAPPVNGSPASAADPAVLDQVRQMGQTLDVLKGRHAELSRAVGLDQSAAAPNGWDVLYGYAIIFLVAFGITLLATPVMRRLAIANNVIDHPDETRKEHRFPIAYLGGVAVFLGILGAIAFAFMNPLHGLIAFHKTTYALPDGVPPPVPMSIILGMTVVMIVGLLDDIISISPWQKVGGQLLAAAALAYEDIGVKVAKQVLTPIGQWIGNADLKWVLHLPVSLPIFGGEVSFDLIYWTGTAVIAVFVLGACNASNLIDGLDGLLSGVTAIAGAGLLCVALVMAAGDNGPLDATRIILCLALMGACMGFLPHNFNPASIFLGDAGSLMLGYITIVIILTLGDQGQTNLVLAGLIIYAIPIIDTALAIVRRKLAGQKISAADNNHLHHILKRKLGVKGAVFTLYGLGAGFAALGYALTEGRSRVTYILVAVFLSFIGVIALKAARRQVFESEAQRLRRTDKTSPAGPEAGPGPAPAPSGPAKA